MIPNDAAHAAESAYRETLTELRLTEGGGFKVASQNRRALHAALEAAHPVLLAELRKAHEALARVETLAERAESHGNLYVFVDDLTSAVAAAKGDASLSDQLKRRPANRVAVDALKAEMLREVESAAKGDEQ